MKLIAFGILVAISVASASNNALYKGYKVYSVEVKSEETLRVLKWIDDHAEEFGADVWSLHRVIGSIADIMIPPKYQEVFELFLKKNTIEYGIKIEDLEKEYDDNDRESRLARRLKREFSNSLDLSRYYSYPEIVEWFRNLEATLGPSVVKVEVAGKSYEGRDIIKVIVCDDGSDKPSIVIDAGIHAREWIAPATAMYFVSQVVESGNHTDLCNGLKYVIIPSVNPDGYTYSLNTDRNWRKTRKPSGNGCIGTDGNRNYGYEWGGPGASTNPCSDTYRGEKAFSEIEADIVRQTLDIHNEAKMYLSIHSYGRYILYPWGWEYSVPKEEPNFRRVSMAAYDAVLAHNGARYSVGGAALVLYVAAGGSDDYAFGGAGIPISITFECAGTGFNPPTTQIQTLVAEHFVALRAMFNEIIVMYGKK